MPRQLARPLLQLTATCFALIVATMWPSAGRAAEPRTRVVLNGQVVPVTFNDGDSFRVLSGDKSGAKARLSGYNTLESYGPAHQWGDWTAKELYVLAKMATLHARRGTWTCTSDGKLDTYGRMLVWCPELAADLVRRGYAHVMSVDDAPARPELIEAQREAQANRRGIWAHGIPPFILTSLHSVEEDTTGHGTYNRLVSTDDGHSAMWKHGDRYDECQTVCQPLYPADDGQVTELAARVAADPKLSSMLAGLSADERRRVIHDYARFRLANRLIPKPQREKFEQLMARHVATWPGKPRNGACMIHVPFTRRYGAGRAACLR